MTEKAVVKEKKTTAETIEPVAVKAKTRLKGKMDFCLRDPADDDKEKCSKITIYAHPLQAPLGGWMRAFMQVNAFLPTYLDQFGDELEITLISNYEINGEPRTSTHMTRLNSHCKDTLSVMRMDLLEPTIEDAKTPNESLV